MSNIDQRVVQMLFDNTSFEHNAAVTLGTMDKLNKGLSLEGAAKGFAGLGDAVKSVTMDPLANGVDHVASRFSALSVVGYTILSNLTNKIVDVGVQMAKSFAIDPIKAGFGNYETQINAVQTILANTGLTGEKGLGKVNAKLAELNTYANQTVYNFSEMAQNIGTFTAAGVDLNTSVSSIKGIANLAALSGSNSQQASTAMYQLSQAIATGSVKLQDWNSVVNAGLGGKVFQTALENTARAAGVNIDAIIKKTGSFRNSLQEGWLTSDVLTKTLSQFTGDLSAAQLKSMGFTAQQAKQIQALGQTALGAATHIKTMSQLSDALKEEVATAYGTIFKTIFGDIGQATDLFTKVHNVAENALTGPIYALNNLLEGWAKLGGRTELIKAFGQAFQDLGAVLAPVREAFRQVFPPATAESLKHLTDVFEKLTEKFKIGVTTSDELRRIFAGLFSVVKIVFDILVKLGETFEAVFGSSLSKKSGSLLDFGARVGDFLVRLRGAVENGQKFNEFFVKLQEVLQVPIVLVKALSLLIKDLFDKLDVGDKAKKSFGSISDSLSSILSQSKILGEAFDYVRSHVDAFYHGVQPLADKLSEFFQNLGKNLTSGSSKIDFSGILRVVDTGLIGGLLLILKKFLDYLVSDKKTGVNGFLDAIKESFEGLTGVLQSMQQTLKAATLLEIAAAIAILALAATKLSSVNGAALTSASLAMTVMFTQLMASIVIFQKFVGTEGFLKLPFLMVSLILLAGAIDILSTSVVKLGKEDWNSLAKGLLAISVMLASLALSVNLMGDAGHMVAVGFGVASLGKGIRILGDVVIQLGGVSWEELGKGLTGLAGVLTALTLFSLIASADTAGAGTGIGVTILAYGILILAKAVKEMGQYSWTVIAKGLDTMAGSLAAIGLVLKLVPPSSIFSAVGVLIVATSLGLIGKELDKMGKESWSQIAHGLTLMAGALTLIAAALLVLPPSTLLSAAAIFIVAASLGMITDALGKMGAQGWGEIAKGLTELAGALVLIAAAVIVMTEGLPGAAALLLVAAAIDLLTPALKAMGDMSWGDIIKSLVELAGVFVVLAVGGVLLEPVIPVLIGLAGAIALLGLGALAAGAGMVLLSIGYTAFAVAAAANTASMVFTITSFLNLLPLVGKEFALSLTSFFVTLGQSAPQLAKAFTGIFTSLLDALTKLIPKIVDTLLELLLKLLQTAAKYVPRLSDAGSNLIVGFLEGLARNMPKVITAGTDVVVAFINGISNNLPRIDKAAFDMVLKFITTTGQSFKANTPKLVSALIQMGGDMIDGLIQGLENGAGKVADTLLQIAKDSIKAPLHWLGINSPSTRYAEVGYWSMAGWGKGVEDNSGIVIDAHSKVAKTSLDVVSQSMSLIGDHLGNAEFQPRIKPVLDMSNLKGSVFDVTDQSHPIDISNISTYNRAAIASEGYTRNSVRNPYFPVEPSTPGVRGPAYNFTQNNYSPKALSETEIYRQTNNQLSAVRGTLVYQSGGTQ